MLLHAKLNIDLVSFSFAGKLNDLVFLNSAVFRFRRRLITANVEFAMQTLFHARYPLPDSTVPTFQA